MGLMGSPAYRQIGHAMGNLLPLHLGGTQWNKGLKTIFFQKIDEIL